MHSREPVIRVEGLGKDFKIYDNPWLRLLDWFSGGSHYRSFRALDEISFRVEAGRCFGIIGPNGAGKSTLLKILAGALFPSRGSFAIRGRPLSLLELGTGFNLELSGRDNLFASAALLGIDEDIVRSRLAEITKFADLGDFIERPLKFYSSGMQVRLAFALFAHLDPEVLIVDEALSVGDIFFQQKCFARMQEIMAAGATCLFVSHDMGAIERFCDRAMLLEAGRCVFIGPANEAISRYYAMMGAAAGSAKRSLDAGSPAPVRSGSDSVAGAMMDNRMESVSEATVASNAIVRVPERDLVSKAGSRHGDRSVEITSVGVFATSGRETLQVEMLESAEFHLCLQAHSAVSGLSAGINLYDRFGSLVFAAGCRQLGVELPELFPDDELSVVLVLQLAVQPGEYTFSLGVSRPAAGPDPNAGIIHDRLEHLGPLVVSAGRREIMPFYGVARLPLTIGWQRD